MKTYSKRTGADWREVLAEWQDSGLSIRGFCRRQGIAEARFYYWRKRLNIEGHPQDTTSRLATFLPVQIKKISTPCYSSGSYVELFLPGGVIVRFSGEISDDRLLRVLKATGAQC